MILLLKFLKLPGQESEFSTSIHILSDSLNKLGRKRDSTALSPLSPLPRPSPPIHNLHCYRPSLSNHHFFQCFNGVPVFHTDYTSSNHILLISRAYFCLSPPACKLHEDMGSCLLCPLFYLNLKRHLAHKCSVIFVVSMNKQG